MKIIKIFALIGAVAMSIALLNGFINGSFFDDGGQILNNPWGIVSLVDLYVGFALFSLWIIYRESSLSAKIIWVILMMFLGFFTASIYLFYAFQTSDNNILKALHGKHARKYVLKD